MTVSVFVPDETTACSLGADAVAAAVMDVSQRQRLEVRLVRPGSRGLFFLEPLLEVETGEGRIGFPRTSADSVGALFSSGMPSVADPDCLGLVDEHAYLAAQQRLTFARVGVIEPTSVEQYVVQGGTQGLQRVLEMTSQQVVDEINASGLRGRGGAAFPAGIKWQTVLDTPAEQKYVVCNADEGDSGTFADRLLMECDPLQLVEGMVIAGVTVGATRGVIYLRSEYPKAHHMLVKALDVARNATILGPSILDSGRSFDIEVVLGAGSYICGEETAMLESIEGRRGMVRKKPPLPAVAGLHGRPTLVHNVLTLAAATSILALGADGYAQLGVDRSRGTMPFQLGGNLACGGLVEIPFGATLAELLDRFGGGTVSGRALAAVQMGGPLGAYFPPDKLDVVLDYEAVAAAGGMIGHGGIVAFDDTVDMAAQAEFAMRFCAQESCGKCTPCRIGSVRGQELIAKIRAGDAGESHFEMLDELMETMELGSLCALGGLTPMPVRSILQGFPGAFGR